jgi:chromosome segregation ATPase
MTMADKQQEEQTLDVNELKKQLDTVTSELNDYKTQFESVKSKADELLSEAKKAKAQRREAEEKAQREAEEKAKAEGNYKELLTSAEKKLKEEIKARQELQSTIHQEKIQNTSLKIAAELADGANAEILSEFVSKRLQYTEEGIKVKDQNGQLTISSIDDLKNEFANSDKYKSLLRGIKSSGGGASGAGDSAPAQKTINRQDFDALPQSKRDQFIASGGKVTS